MHDAASELVGWIGEYCPALAEPAGYQLLVDQGMPDRLARFARTHAAWTQPDIGINDLLVSCADKVWKAKRVPDLEQLIVERLATANGSEPWQAFLDLDDELTRIAADADRKLEFQNRHPVTA